VRFTILGPLAAWREGVEVELGPPTRRALLALLLAHAGQPVTLTEIIDVLWGAEPPDTATNIVHRHVGMLRRLIDPGAAEGPSNAVLPRNSGGYRLPVDADTLDLVRFRQLTEEAERALDAGSPVKAAELFAEALSLWPAVPVLGIPGRVRTHPTFAAIAREGVVAVRAFAAAALTAGRPELAEASLRRAVADDPLDEASQASLILVLAAIGHQAEALDTYQQVRSRLAEELGVDPGAELRSAYDRVLQQSVPARGATEPRTWEADPWPEPVRPTQLPADLPSFTGRRFEVDQIRALLDRPQTAMPISVVCGMAGVGKTSLAVHVAHEIAHLFPDGQLHVNLRGFDQNGLTTTPAEVIRTLLEALGVAPQRIPASWDGQVALYRSLLAGRRVLVLLDNARDTEHARPLLPGAPGCMAIVTSRDQLRGLVAGGATPLTLGLLSPAEARESLVHRLGADRVDAEPRAVEEIIDRCGRLPLALAVVAARAALYPTFPLAAIAAELRRGHGSLDAFAGTDPATDARSVFSWTYRAITPAAARLFRLLAGHPGPDTSVAAAASLVGLPVRRTRDLLAELTGVHLVTELAPGRFACHDLLRAYAAELAAEQEDDDGGQDAQQRLLDHYVHTASAASTLLHPYQEHVPLLPAPRPDAVVEQLTDQQQAKEWLADERAVLQAVMDRATRTGFPAHGCQLGSALEACLGRLGRWQDLVAVQRAAVLCADQLADPFRQADAHRALGFGLCRLAAHQEAGEHLRLALNLFGGLDHHSGQGRTHRALAFQANMLDEHQQALAHYEQAAAHYRASDNRRGIAWVRNEVGWTYILLGDYEHAIEQCQQSVEVHQETGDEHGMAAALDSLGYAHHHLGRYEEAITCYRRALVIYQAAGDLYLEADTLDHVGDAQAALGAAAAAGYAWRAALVIFEELGHSQAKDVRDKLG
jgi:DNA-binding SARP family transcriptional activator